MGATTDVEVDGKSIVLKIKLHLMEGFIGRDSKDIG